MHNTVSHDSDTLTHTLTIMEVIYSDEGQYQCTARNDINNTTYNDSAVFTLQLVSADIIDATSATPGTNGYSNIQ